jgi:DnaJ-class molecular chaperone
MSDVLTADEKTFICECCGGTGHFIRESVSCNCSPCHGTGKMTKQEWMDWCEEKLECQRCGGTGDYTLVGEEFGDCTTKCRPCGGTGKVTKKQWNEWCDMVR